MGFLVPSLIVPSQVQLLLRRSRLYVLTEDLILYKSYQLLLRYDHRETISTGMSFILFAMPFL